MPSLTSVGSPTFNGDSTCTIDATGDDRLSVLSPLSATRSWWAHRLNANFASTDDPYAGNDPRLCRWEVDNNNRVDTYYMVATDVWGARRVNGGAFTEVTSSVQSFGANTDVTVIFAWEAAQLKLSVNGGAFTALADANIPSMGSNSIYLGNRAAGGRALNADFYWVAMGTGTLTDGDAVTIHGFGNTDPSPNAIPGTPVFLWTADSVTYLASPFPAVEPTIYNFGAYRDHGGIYSWDNGLDLFWPTRS